MVRTSPAHLELGTVVDGAQRPEDDMNEPLFTIPKDFARKTLSGLGRKPTIFDVAEAMTAVVKKATGEHVEVVLGSDNVTMVMAANEVGREKAVALLKAAGLRLTKTDKHKADPDEPDFQDGLFLAWLDGPAP